jgi:hypothetical protein
LREDVRGQEKQGDDEALEPTEEATATESAEDRNQKKNLRRMLLERTE